MSGLILSLLLKAWPVILAALGALFWGIKQRRAGAASERAKQAAAEKRARDVADEIDDAVAGRSPDENRERLRKWSAR